VQSVVRKILGLLLVILCVTVSAENVFAGTNVKTWRNPSLKIDSLKKILVLPVYADLRAGFELQPKNELAKNFEKWAVEGVKSALNNPKKKKE
ncbi:MAG: hypothetical protein IJQ58_09930, partial [Synergistaceae bacterium]|nr:hypothetical protein [Synergistaceae bacterium]